MGIAHCLQVLNKWILCRKYPSHIWNEFFDPSIISLRLRMLALTRGRCIIYVISWDVRVTTMTFMMKLRYDKDLFKHVEFLWNNLIKKLAVCVMQCKWNGASCGRYCGLACNPYMHNVSYKLANAIREMWYWNEWHCSRVWTYYILGWLIRRSSRVSVGTTLG